MKKQLLFLFIFLNIGVYSLAQKSLCLSFGTGVQTALTSDFKYFMKDYNDVLKPEIKNNLSMHGIPINYQLGANYYFGKIAASINFSWTRTDYRVTFNSGEARDIVIKYRTPIDVGAILALGEKSHLSFRFGYATSNIISEYIYADGTRSLNHNLSMNGVYSTFGSFMKLNLMIKIYKNLKLDAGITRFNGTSAYMDKNYAKGLGDGDFFVFPKDYKTYTNLYNQGLIYEFPLEKGLHMKSLQVNLGLVYFLNFTK